MKFLIRSPRFAFRSVTFCLRPLLFLFLASPHGLLFHIALPFFFRCFASHFVCHALCLPTTAKDHYTDSGSDHDYN
jgi:hypothetical protein